MSVSELNHFMTYVIEGWMLFSAGFIATTFVSFVSRRIQEDMATAALAEGVTEEVTASVTESVTATEAVNVTVAPSVPPAPTPGSNDSAAAEGTEADTEADITEDEKEAARLEEVAAVSEQLAKNRGKQADSSSVSVST